MTSPDDDDIPPMTETSIACGSHESGLKRYLSFENVMVLATGLSLGVTLRFWRGVYEMLTVRRSYVIDFTPMIYWLVGLVFSAAVLQVAIRKRVRFQRHLRSAFITLNVVSFLSFLCVPFYMIWNRL